MRRLLLLLPLLLAGVSGCTQNPAPVDYRGSQFYGRDGRYASGGYELPKYSNENRAELPPEQEAKYHSDVQQYGVAAEIGGVAASDLPPPSTLTPPPAPSPDPYIQSQQAAPPITMTQTVPPAASVTPDPNAVDYYGMESAEVQGATTAPAADPNATPQFIWPIRGDILSAYSASSKGISIKGQKGDPIRASDDGVVRGAGVQGDMGTLITVEHAGGWTSSYGHVGESVVKSGDQVVRGQLIGFVGATGNVTVPQLYFSLSKAGSPADPNAVLVND